MHRNHAFAPADAAGYLFNKQALHFGGIAGDGGGDVGEDRHSQRARRSFGQRFCHGIGCWLHQRTMERGGDRQDHAALDLEILDHCHCAFDCRLVAGQYDLTRIVVIGDGANFAFSCRIGQRLSLGEVCAE